MAKWCQNCGRYAPDDAILCPYCSAQLDSSKSYVTPVSQEKKEDSKKIITIVVVVLVVGLLVTVAIAATVYVYVSGLTSPIDNGYEEPYVYVIENNGQIQVTLYQKGDSYVIDYQDFDIYVNNLAVENLFEVGFWTVGEEINIGESNTGYKADGDPLDPGEYSVTVVIMDNVMYDGSVTIH